jgi:uncharacterized C2H2 Zn-finger protein
MELIKNSKNSSFMYCDKCDFTCSNKNDMSRHLLRRKHLLNADGIKMELKKLKKLITVNAVKNTIRNLVCGSTSRNVLILWTMIVQ